MGEYTKKSLKMKRMIKPMIEKLGEAPAVLRVKKVRGFWICGCSISSDCENVRITYPCGKGGVIECTRERAIVQTLHSARRDMELGCWKDATFEKAKAIMRNIEGSVQPKLF